MAAISKVKADKLIPLRDTIIVSDMQFSERITRAGLIILNDDMKSGGIRPRWAKVYAIGDEVNNGIKVGQWILVAHGRWTRGITLDTPQGEVVIRKVDNKDILLVSDELVQDETMSDKVF